MTVKTPADAVSLRPALAAHGYVFVESSAMRSALEAAGPLTDWPAFAASWDDLPVDEYLAGRGRYRRRRHAVFSAGPDGPIVREPHQPHYQGVEYNTLFGGIARWFEPVAPDVAAGPTMTAILQWCLTFFDGFAPAGQRWRIETHQFRIEAGVEAGQPTPEGVHRDGVDYVLVLLVSRENIASGTTTVYSIDRQPLGSFTLTAPLDAVVVDDARVCHGVTPVRAIDPSRPAHRDVLVVTFRRIED